MNDSNKRYVFTTESGKTFTGRGDDYYKALSDTDYNENKDGEIEDFETYIVE